MVTTDCVKCDETFESFDSVDICKPCRRAYMNQQAIENGCNTCGKYAPSDIQNGNCTDCRRTYNNKKFNEEARRLGKCLGCNTPITACMTIKYGKCGKCRSNIMKNKSKMK